MLIGCGGDPPGWDGNSIATVLHVDRDEWRLALRGVLGAAMADGGRIVGFRRTEGYVIHAGNRRSQ